MKDKEIIIFPYINIDIIIKMGDLEIHPYKDYDFTQELKNEEKEFLDQFVYSFREAFFEKDKTPKIANGIGILKYKGTILRTVENSEGIDDNIKILFLFLKLHISHDFFNPRMNYINIKSFDYFGFNLKNNFTNKFGNMRECDKLHTTIPENITGLGKIKFYPIQFCTNYIPVEFKIFGGGDQIFGLDSKTFDISYLYEGIIKNNDYYNKCLNIASINYGLEQQNDLFFYYSIIPSIIEVLLQLNSNDIKKQQAIEYGKKLDNLIIKDNEKIETLIYVKKKGDEIKEELGLIARSMVTIYDLRNELLHEGKKSFNKLKVSFKGFDLRIYEIFQLFFKYSILNDLIEQQIIDNNFNEVEIDGNVYTSGNIQIKTTTNKQLSMDNELNNLIEKVKSDKKIKGQIK